MQCPDPHTEALCVQNPHHGISNSACSPITRPQKTTVQYSEVEGIRAERLRKVLDSVFVDAACLRTFIFADSADRQEHTSIIGSVHVKFAGKRL